ncbi:cation:proton antiporter [Candidatus Woesebacteria bacterium]|nr:cation:proton antiporter [Candidatus Woesebacteria bacterium]
MPVFIEICVVLALATAVSFVMKLLKQPLIVGYILTGIIAGPYGLNILHAKETLELFSKFGVTILLFIIGIHLSPKVIKELGRTSFLVGIGQIIFTSIVGFGIAFFLGLDRIAALYVAIALTLSSTIIILKLISDKGDTHKLYSKLTISLLIIQDLVATFILLFVTSLSSSPQTSVSQSFLPTLLKTLAMVALFAIVIKFVVPKLMQFASKSQELLFLFSLTWGLGVAYVSTLVGLSIEVGALIAGVAISSSEFAEEISSKLQPLRDFFVVLFFIFLGSHMVLDFTLHDLIPISILSAFVLIGNPIILIIIMNLLGYHKKTSYMAGMAIAQISEFSLILATLGMQVGHLSQATVTLITIVGLITISGSSYMIMYSENLYPYIKKLLEFLELKKNNIEISEKKIKYDVFLFGFNRSGNDLLSTFRDMSYKTAIVDFDPDTKERVPKNFKNFLYGDASDIEFLQKLNFKDAQLIVSTLPTNADNALLIKHAKNVNEKIVVLLYAHTKKDALEYYELGADYVILPHHIGVKHASMLIKKIGISTNSFKRRKSLHLKELELSLLD